MARPKKLIKRVEVVRVRVTSAEARLLRSFADKHGITVSSFIREKILDHKLKPRLTTEETAFLRGLIGMANNLNTITRKVHMGDATGMLLSEALLEIGDQIKKLHDK